MSKIMNGKELALKIKAGIREKVSLLKSRGINPKLAIILAGNSESSKIYVREKIRSCREVGIDADLLHLQEAATEDLVNEVKKLNSDDEVHSILVQLPLPENINENIVLESINPKKDVDCLNPLNLGRLLAGDKCVESCTPKGIMKILEEHSISLEGKNSVIINRSKIIGKPLALMMLKKNATVKICHSKTKDLVKHTKDADIIVIGVGRKKFLTSEMIKEGAVIIDVGINKEAGKVIGDVDLESVKGKASYITPVPGGVGPMTVAMVLENTVELIERNTKPGQN
jgi:methylenetetrahydrofolate dehydrogenase (NADP+) / methenyltetrahydrofolate cyclohydrolase